MTNHAGESSRLNRIRSLDGLRGLAAAIVLLHHSLLIFPGLAAPYFEGDTSPWSFEWWLVNTPLHLLWEGTVAVYVFFILSGVVLAKPVYAAIDSFNWRVFYPQRLLRLYVPVWAAVVIAALTFFLVPRNPAMESAWLQSMPTEVTIERAMKDATLLAGNGWLASPLWSLRWEILFSLLLPAYIWAGKRLRRHAVYGAVVCLALIFLGGTVNQSALRYMPMFALGVLLAPFITSAGVTFRGLSHQSNYRVRLPLLISALLLLNLRWLVPALSASPLGSGVLLSLAAVGACGVVLCAVADTKVRGFLETPPLQWLGRISFSLYLIHEPIVVTVAHLFGPGHEWGAFPVSLSLSVLAGALFYRFIEVPSYRLSKIVGHSAHAHCTGSRSPSDKQGDVRHTEPEPFGPNQ